MIPRIAPSLAVPVEPADHMRGPEHARVTLVEYGDFECPNCRMAAATPALLLDQFPNHLRFVFRHFPLEEAHPHALLAAEAAEAAAAQGKFWPMHDLLLQGQAHLKDKDLHRYAAQLDLDLVRFAAEMGDRIYLQRVREHIEGGRRSHLRATPTFFLAGQIIDVSFGMQALRDAVTGAIARHG